MAVTYCVYGLLVEIAAPVAGLVVARDARTPDIRLHLAPERFATAALALGDDTLLLADNEAATPLPVADGSYVFRYSDGMTFIMSPTGADISVRWVAPSTLADVMTYFLNPVMGFALRLRGLLCLHASAVVFGQSVIAFCGGPGAGKSTIAALFAKSGIAVMTDDILPIYEQNSAFIVPAGYSFLKLWPDSSEMLFGRANAFPALTPTWPKQFVDLLGGQLAFATTPGPLGIIYLLKDREEDASAPHVQAISARDAMVGLIANSYPGAMLAPSMRAAEIGSISRVIAKVPVRALTAHVDPARMPALRDAIVADLVGTSIISERLDV